MPASRHKAGQRLGALVVETAGGVRFNVGTGLSDAEQRSPAELSATITYGYQALTAAGVPRFPSSLRMRRDL